MRDVAAAADVALGTVYRYFASKERLLLEAMAEQQSRLARLPRRAPAPRSPRPWRAWCRVLRGANRRCGEYPDVRGDGSFVRAAEVENADIVRRVTETHDRDTPTRSMPRTPGRNRGRGPVARILMQVWPVVA